MEHRLQPVCFRMKNQTQAKARAPHKKCKERKAKTNPLYAGNCCTFAVGKPSAREEEPRTHDEPEVARALQRSRRRDRRPHRLEARGVGFAPQRAIPDVVGHSENRGRFAKMMR